MGTVAQKYKNRVRRAQSEEAKLRGRVRKLLRDGLVKATDVQLYQRTPLRVTGKMRRSVFTKSDRNSIAVGYKGAVAPHNAIRLAKKGRSKLGGHDMQMEPAEFIEVVQGDKIAREARGSLQRILGA
jgi:hypothetical protein